MGLMTTHFNALSGTLRKNNKFILGSSDGAVEFDKDMKLPRSYSSKMIFSDFKLFYQTIYPGDEDSPLKASINDTKVLKLKYNQKDSLCRFLPSTMTILPIFFTLGG